jgi:hypothetical protein
MYGELVKDQKLNDFIYYPEVPIGVEVGSMGEMVEDEIKNDGLRDTPENVDGEYGKGFRAAPNQEHQKQ